MFRGICITVLSFAALIWCGEAVAQQPAVEARIAGLENNEEYMSLLRRDAQLQVREDSIMHVVSGMRHRLHDEPDNRQRYTQEILRLESLIFDLRTAKGRLIDRINAIEQEWVLANLNSASASEPSSAAEVTIPDSLKVRNLVYNSYFRDCLAPEDYAALRRAQRMEPQAVDYVNRFLVNHGTATDLAEAYAAARTEGEALEIHDRFEALERQNAGLADSLSTLWNYIYDNKSYAYSYVLDRLGEEEILSREEELAARASRQMTTLRGETASDAVADYFLRKRVIVDYEEQVARVLGLTAAADSLRGVAGQLETVDFRLPKVRIAERSFLDYDTVAFSSHPKYTYQNPIPECKVYANGTIYRILLGTFNTKRAAATFRGAYPLFYLINDAGKWCYYTGGFATFDEAEAARKLLKEHGFIRPEIVVWADGVYRNLAQEPDTAATFFRIEIAGTEALSEAVKQAIAEQAGSAELSRAGHYFVVGTFDDRAVADRVAEAIRRADDTLEIKVVEIAE